MNFQSDDIRLRRQTTVDQIASGLPGFAAGKGRSSGPSPQLGLGSEIGFNVVLGAQQPRLERRYKRVVAQL